MAASVDMLKDCMPVPEARARTAWRHGIHNCVSPRGNERPSCFGAGQTQATAAWYCLFGCDWPSPIGLAVRRALMRLRTARPACARRNRAPL